MSGDHYGFVVSLREFNDLGFALVCPISGGGAETFRSRGFLVTLMGLGLVTDGNIHVHQVKSLDLRARKAIKRCSTPEWLVDEVLSVLSNITS